jgi:hypothetical protein
MSRSRNFVFTHNNWTEESRAAISALDCKYMAFGREVAPSTGTPHLQGFIVFQNARSLEAVRNMFSGLCQSHVEVMKGTIEQNLLYISKEDPAFFEKGVKPASQKEKGQKGAEKIAAMWDAAKKGEFEKLPVGMIKTAEYVHAKYGPQPSNRDSLDNIWIWGESGVGKSKWVRDTYPVFYTKPMSKWWDGYQHEEVVCLDDFAPEHAKFLTYHLKIWADHYVIQAEVKGGMLRIRPKVFVITSQFSPEDCWPSDSKEDRENRAAIRRRFRVVHLVRSDAERVAQEHLGVGPRGTLGGGPVDEGVEGEPVPCGGSPPVGSPDRGAVYVEGFTPHSDSIIGRETSQDI